jgi:hypothetical protein
MATDTPVMAQGDLPPTEYLIMETLAARHRLGEPFWTFPLRLRTPLNALQGKGLIWTRSAPTPDLQAHLTDEGRACCLSGTYEPPPRPAPAPESAAGLARMLADLEGFIERRAAEMAAPLIEECERSRQTVDTRIPDLQQEHGRQIAALDRQLARTWRQLEAAKAESRQNAGIAAAATGRATELERQLAEVTSDG